MNRTKRVYRPKTVYTMIGIAKSTLKDWTDPKSDRFMEDFPKQFKLGAHAVGYDADEIDAWLTSKSGR